MQLIIPLGGLSRRYGLKKPKWLLTHPDGRYMIEHAVDCMDPSRFSQITMVLTEEVLAEFELPADIIKRIFRHRIYCHSVREILLSGSSGSQLETVARAVSLGGLTGPAIVKDSDNRFALKSIAGNFVATRVVGPDDDVRHLQMKSFVRMSGAAVAEIVEKRVIGNEFCVGAYGFENIDELHGALLGVPRAHYMSDAVNAMIFQGNVFSARPAGEYDDWGTIAEWNDYCGQFRNLFVDIDGVLFDNGSRAMEPLWGENRPIAANVEALKRVSTDRVKLYFVTARGEAYREATERQLRAAGLRWDGLVMGLFHAGRLLINDFSTAPGSRWPTAEALNVVRNSDDLASALVKYF